MWFWRRKEIYMGNSLEEFSRVRNLLTDHQIRNDYRVSDRLKAGDSPRVASLGRMGNDPSRSTMYSLFVDKQDYEFAVSLLNTSRQGK